MYSAVVMDHFAHPRNVGSIEEADAIGQAGAPGQGHYLVLSLRIEDGRIAEACFQTYGCPGMIASGSVLTEWVAGQTLADAKAITWDALAERLGGLPLGREFCAQLAVDALRDALGKVAAGEGGRR